MKRQSIASFILVVCIVVLGGAAVAHGELGWIFTLNDTLPSAPSYDVALGDLDADGDLDAFVANVNTLGDRAWLNQGGYQGGVAGTFLAGDALGDFESRGVALGDVDVDGDLDAFVATYHDYQSNRIFLNNGDGIFSDSMQELGYYASEDVAVEDLDGDGFVDAVFASDMPYPDTVWLTDAGGNFTGTPQELTGSPSKAIALGDINGVNGPDIFVAVNGEANQVWLNDGTGSFVQTSQPLGAGSSYDVALGDVNNDGHLDAVVANYGENEVWLNDRSGNGTFVEPSGTFGPGESAGVALADLDGDGYLDAVIAEADPTQPSSVWLNDRSGGFSDSGLSLGNFASQAVAVGPLDLGLGLDVFVANYDSTSQVWVKTGPNAVTMGESQVSAGGVWWLPVAGALAVLTLVSWGWEHRRR